MSAIGLLIVGAILVIIAYYVPAGPPPFLKVILNAAGWICIVVGAILLVAYLLGLPIALGVH